MKRKKLVIISHTEHYLNNKEIVGWGPTVNEINFLSDFWEEVIHLACLYEKEKAPQSSRPYTNKNIKFVALPPTGGKKLWNKFDIIWNLPFILKKVSQSINGATDVQFRSPTGIGTFLLPAFSFLLKRNFTFWAKYAGNWSQQDAPLGYRFQKWWLKRNFAKCKVTINGFWQNQPQHCLSFENPCLNEQDIVKGKSIQNKKHFSPPYHFVFVGRLEDEKGVSKIIEALKSLEFELIERVDFVGDGEKRKHYEEQTTFLREKVKFHGYLNKDDVHKILSESHFFLLPSDSEGFPKVIAEAGCYGCIPVVSNVGSIGHYIIEQENGFLWNLDGTKNYSEILQNTLDKNSDDLNKISKSILDVAKKFTFENYHRKLEKYILD